MPAQNPSIVPPKYEKSGAEEQPEQAVEYVRDRVNFWLSYHARMPWCLVSNRFCQMHTAIVCCPCMSVSCVVVLVVGGAQGRALVGVVLWRFLNYRVQKKPFPWQQS